ncbi:g8481 [Coccomyxa viridis]|uniref:G8481 protein n=1 Tax=Coccomyxa viridis TaxID=1274662 RepID=A0ABP1G1I7_9CHLO
MGKNGKFQYVYIPADVSEPLQELSLSYTEEDQVQCLLHKLREHFRQSKPAKTAEQLQRQRQQLLANVPEESRAQINEQMLGVATDLGTVESIALLSNSRDNGFTGVNLYCDDEASFVDALPNPRASEIAFCCGKQMQVQGDAFLARVFDNEDDFERLDFTLKEVTSSAPWVKEAAAQNEAKRKGDQADTILQSMQAPAQQGKQSSPAEVTELTPAEAARESGNAAFKKGDLQKALELYTEAVEQDRSMAAAYSNRALVNLKLGQAAAAEADANQALQLDPKMVKALLRRAAARKALGQTEGAVEDYRAAMKLQPNNKEAAQALQDLQASKELSQ